MPPQRTSSLTSIFTRALLNSVLNPKALLFFMVFLPQFVVSDRGPVPLQLAILGVSLSLIALVFHASLGVFSGKVSTLFLGRTALTRCAGWLHAGLFAGLAARLLWLDKPVTR